MEEPFDMLEEITITGLYTSVINDELRETSNRSSADQAVKIYMADGDLFWH